MPRKASRRRSVKKSPKRRRSKPHKMWANKKSRAFGALRDKVPPNCPKQGFVFTPAVEERGTECLLIIDPQNDFIKGSLKVDGSEIDMRNICNFITKHRLQSIVVTLDTHSLFHVGNAYAYDNMPEIITPIDTTKISSLKPKQIEAKELILRYITKLNKSGKTHTLWPLHCQIGTSGHNIYYQLNECLKQWSNRSKTEVRYIMKGCDTLYENFSVFRSAIVTNFENTKKEAYKFNIDLAEHLRKFKNLYICGEARTHCVADSTMDYIKWAERNNKCNQNIYILWDCMSDVKVPGVSDVFGPNRHNFYEFCTSLDRKCHVRVVNSDIKDVEENGAIKLIQTLVVKPLPEESVLNRPYKKVGFQGLRNLTEGTLGLSGYGSFFGSNIF